MAVHISSSAILVCMALVVQMLAALIQGFYVDLPFSLDVVTESPLKKTGHGRRDGEPHGCGCTACHATCTVIQSALVSPLPNLRRHLLSLRNYGRVRYGWSKHACAVSTAEPPSSTTG